MALPVGRYVSLFLSNVTHVWEGKSIYLSVLAKHFLVHRNLEDLTIILQAHVGYEMMNSQQAPVE